MDRVKTMVLAAALLLVAVAGRGHAAAAQTMETDGTAGTVYTLTNTPMRNDVIAYRRAADGTLTMQGTYDTGGLGSGAYENSDTMIVLGSAAGQSSPVDLGGGSDLLFAANAGSDEISVFQVGATGELTLVETEPSGGERPTSLTVNNGLLYVMNSAGDGLPGAGFCFGGEPSISGFRVAPSGELTPIPGSTRKLSGGVGSGCTQVSFNPGGDVLIAMQIGSDKIDTFTIGDDGVASGPLVNESSGTGPFGLTFDREGRLLTTENFGAKEEQGAVASYSIGNDGRLAPIGESIPIGETDPCWIVLSPDGAYAYTSSFGPNPILAVADESSRRGTISSFQVGDDGRLTLLDAQAAQVGVGSVDIALGGNGRYLYALNSVEGAVKGFRVEQGTLTPITTVDGIPTNPYGPLSGGLAARDDGQGGDTVPMTMPNTGLEDLPGRALAASLVGGTLLVVGGYGLRRQSRRQI